MTKQTSEHASGRPGGNSNDALARVAETGILPVIAIPSVEAAVPLADALVAGGVRSIEVTLRNPWALEAIAAIRKAHPDMAIGAGTVLAEEQVAAARAAGADFLVSPGFDPEVVRVAQTAGLPIVPGVVNPSQVTAAVKMGLKVLKFFPAEQSGGLAALTLLHEPFPDVSFVPTGGLTLANIGAYLDKPFVAACGGSYMAKSADIVAGDWAKITDLCRQCVDVSLGFSLAHVGLNSGDAGAAAATVARFADLFRQPVRDGSSSTFAGTAVECMKTPFYGEKGHVGFSVRSVERALAWYRSRGVPVREESIRRTADGSRLQSFYLAEEPGGFAVHVVRKS
jgi:2-dehydro-3-deoxyphosphogluconate aldolase / (4S)-4-hydroxy-2-oxoglutarate aldolase